MKNFLLIALIGSSAPVMAVSTAMDLDLPMDHMIEGQYENMMPSMKNPMEAMPKIARKHHYISNLKRLLLQGKNLMQETPGLKADLEAMEMQYPEIKPFCEAMKLLTDKFLISEGKESLKIMAKFKKVHALKKEFMHEHPEAKKELKKIMDKYPEFKKLQKELKMLISS